MVIYLYPFLLSALLAVLYETKLVRLDRTFYGLALLLLAIFSGLRFEVGQDWYAYEAFFDRLDLNANIIDIYSKGYQPFEVGYYLLNYVVKALGGTYSVVFLIVALFFSLALYRFTKRFAVNRFYILTIYISYSFLILNFAQVRQAAAIGFFIFGCDYYLCHQNRVHALTIASIGILFQYTSLMYIVLFAVVLFWPKRKRKTWTVIGLGVAGIALYAMSLFTDFYSVLASLSPTTSLQEKVAIYEEMQTEQGIGQQLYAGYLLVLVIYFSLYLKSVSPKRAFIVRYAIISLLLTILFVVIFPGSYAIYSRAYVVASVFQAYAAALIFSATKRRVPHTEIFVLTLVASLMSYYRLISFYEDEYIPYKMVISLLGP